MAFRIRSFARRHRRSWIVRRLAAKCEKFLYGYYNEGFYDLERNGEAKIIAALAAARKADPSPLLVFDVGANRGEYAKAVLRLAPDAIVHCFEIVPAVAALLKDALADRPAAHVHDFGLSNAAGEAAVSWNRAWDTASAIVARAGDPLFADSEVTTVMGRVDTGDAVAARLAVAAIDLLKIDVEGHELEVLLGFRETLRSAGRRPRVIQFEYGATWLPARHNLQEAYALLEPLGYRIGRLYPDGVEFKPYAFADDHFRMGNYVAAQGGDPLLERLARF